MPNQKNKFLSISIALVIVSLLIAGGSIYYAFQVKKDADNKIETSSITTSSSNNTNSSTNVTSSTTSSASQIAQTSTNTNVSLDALAPKNISNFNKNVNVGVYDDGNGKGGTYSCGIAGVIDYIPKDTNAIAEEMLVTSSSLKLDADQTNSFNNLNNLLTGQTSFTPDKLNYTSQFANACGGFTGLNQLMDAPNLPYPGTDNVKVIYALQGQEFLLSPVVIVFAQKENNQIWLQTSPSNYSTDDIAKSCGYALGGSSFDSNCYSTKLKADTTLKSKLDQAAQKLVTDFAL